MNNFENFTLTRHFIDFFNQNAECFNDPKSEEKVFAEECLEKTSEGLVITEKIELPAMENPKHFFRFFSHKKMQMLFDACPEAAARLGPRPWKHILMNSPEYVERCPCIGDFSQDEKELILRRRPELATYFHQRSVLPSPIEEKEG